MRLGSFRRSSRAHTDMGRWAAEMRERPTPAEARLVRTLRRLDIPFDHQRIFGKYIVDVYLPGRAIAVEVDGGYHDNKQQRAKDALRTKVLKKFHGVAVFRIPNKLVFAPDFAEYLQAVVASTPEATVRRSRPASHPTQVWRRRNGVVSALMSPEATRGRLEGKRTQTPGHPLRGNPAPQETGQVRGSTTA